MLIISSWHVKIQTPEISRTHTKGWKCKFHQKPVAFALKTIRFTYYFTAAATNAVTENYLRYYIFGGHHKMDN